MVRPRGAGIRGGGTILPPTHRLPASPSNHPRPVQAGEAILREGEALDEAAKFFILEAGQVDCFRAFEVGEGLAEEGEKTSWAG